MITGSLNLKESPSPRELAGKDCQLSSGPSIMGAYNITLEKEEGPNWESLVGGHTTQEVPRAGRGPNTQAYNTWFLDRKGSQRSIQPWNESKGAQHGLPGLPILRWTESCVYMNHMCPTTADYIYTGAGHIIRISSKSWFISLIPFKKWNLYNVYIHSTQTDIFQVFISFNFDDYNWQLMKTPNSVSQKIRILLKTNTKKGILEILANWKVWTWKVWACTALNT